MVEHNVRSGLDMFISCSGIAFGGRWLNLLTDFSLKLYIWFYQGELSWWGGERAEPFCLSMEGKGDELETCVVDLIDRPDLCGYSHMRTEDGVDHCNDPTSNLEKGRKKDARMFVVSYYLVCIWDIRVAGLELHLNFRKDVWIKYSMEIGVDLEGESMGVDGNT